MSIGTPKIFAPSRRRNTTHGRRNATHRGRNTTRGRINTTHRGRNTARGRRDTIRRRCNAKGGRSNSRRGILPVKAGRSVSRSWFYLRTSAPSADWTLSADDADVRRCVPRGVGPAEASITRSISDAPDRGPRALRRSRGACGAEPCGAIAKTPWSCQGRRWGDPRGVLPQERLGEQRSCASGPPCVPRRQ